MRGSMRIDVSNRRTIRGGSMFTYDEYEMNEPKQAHIDTVREHIGMDGVRKVQ